MLGRENENMNNGKDIKKRILEIVNENVGFLKTEGLTTFEKKITISSIIIGISCALRSVECDIVTEEEILNEVVRMLAEKILKHKVLVNQIMKEWEKSTM